MLEFRAPLFDRLIDEAPKETEETPPFITYDTEGLYYSVAEEVSRLLNTRSFYARWQAEEMPDEIRWSVIGYGYVDFSGVTSESQEEWQQLAERMAETVMRFEPRFLNVHVEIDRFEAAQQELILNLYGDVLVDAVYKRIHFPLVLKDVDSGEDIQARANLDIF